jgi:arylsulfatase A-like enzyme/Flp pilus assembly protein TadD
MRWLRPFSPFLVLILLAGCGGTPETAGTPGLNLLLVTVDTLRADALGSYGSTAGATPVLDALAARGVRFETAWSVAPLTTPAHSSVLTGLYPGTHGVRANGRLRLPNAHTTLAEVLAGEGYRTGAAVAAYPACSTFGLGQGFQSFDEDFGVTDEGEDAYSRSAPMVNAAAIPWLRAASADSRPWFLWAHYYDPHDPYNAPEPFASRFADRPYLGEVAAVDAAIGELLEALEATGQAERTVVVVASDHGEGLGDHGEYTHGALVYETTVRVPLIIVLPGRSEGRVERRPASLVDIMPTVLSLLGAPTPPGVQGEDLFAPAEESAGAPARPLYAESFHAYEEFRWSPLRTMLLGSDKVVLGPDVEWYDLEEDPGETRNLAPEDPAAAAALVERLRELAVGYDQEVGEDSEFAMSPEERQALEALGYVAGGGGVEGDTWDLSGRHPREAIDDYTEFQRIAGLVGENRTEEALRVLDRLLESEPGNPQFLLHRGENLIKLGQTERGEADLREALEIEPPFYFAYLSLSRHYLSQERLQEALAVWDLWDEKEGKYSFADLPRARVLVRLERYEEARQLLRRYLESSPGDADALALLGDIESKAGSPELAVERYLQALETAPSDVQLNLGLAVSLVQLGRFAEALPVLDRAIFLSPADAQIRSRRAFVLAKLRRLPEALEEARTAMRLDPETLAYQQNLGSLLGEAGRWEEAARVFDDILAEDPGFTPALFASGLIKQRRGDRAGAEAAFREVLAREPGHAGARRRLSELGLTP